MERLTEEKQIGTFAALKDKAEAVLGAFGTYDCLYSHMVAVTRLKQYEDAMPLERAQELSQAEKDGRLVVLPCKPGDELIRNGLAFKADHWNVLLTAFADDASAPLGKKVKLFYPEEAETALKKREGQTMRQIPEKELDVFELELAIKLAHAATLMDKNPEVSYLFALSETALREKLERLKNPPPPNDPLTLKELREMDGEPVWVRCLNNEDYSGWIIADLCFNGCQTKYFYAYFDYYGEEWLAYRRKPEEGTG